MLLFSGDFSIKALNLPSNVRTIKWAPQNDVLGHHSVQACVSHGGENSLYEAAYHAVPMVVIPCVADQGENAVKVKALVDPHALAGFQIMCNLCAFGTLLLLQDSKSALSPHIQDPKSACACYGE